MRKCFILVLALSLSCIPAFSSVTQLIFNGESEEVLKIASKYLPESPVIVEAGAYNGDDTKKMAKFWPSGQIYAFEPMPELFCDLCEIAKSFPQVTVYQEALGDKSRSAVFYTSSWVDRPSLVGGSSSLLPPKEHLKFDPTITFPAEIFVKMISLDDWATRELVDKVDFFWLDMQGYERNMLEVSKIAKQATVIYAEVEFAEAYKGQYLYWDVKEWLEANDFDIIAADFDESCIAEELKEGRYFGNVLCVKKRELQPVSP